MSMIVLIRLCQVAMSGLKTTMVHYVRLTEYLLIRN